MTSVSGVHWLHELARLYGVQTAYYDVSQRRRPAAVETLLALLRSLGAPVDSLEDIPAALRERRQALWQRPLEPVTVAWEGTPAAVRVHLPEDMADYPLSCSLEIESGEYRHWQCRGADLPVVEAEEVEGVRFISRKLPLPDELPRGYHHLNVEIDGRVSRALIISAPVEAYHPTSELEARTWGVFLPLYALHGEKGRSGGDYGDLADLADWAAGIGGGVVATLPLLPTFTETPTDVSPYLPVSRQMWSELYLNIDSIPELPDCPPAQALLESSSYQREIEALCAAPLVDYERQVVLKRQVLAELCRCLFAGPSARREALSDFVTANPAVEDYARFRAMREKEATPWSLWPQRPRDGELREGDYEEEGRWYHLYVQWLAHQQMESLSEKLKDRSMQLYLDLPAGVHPDGYDAWREQAVFMTDVSAGAPPDAVFTGGQDWLFPPLHPEKVRERGYRYVIDCLHHHLRHAGILRLDHVMGLHRLFCIPGGMGADRGTYIRYRAEEFYAILALESWRHNAVIVGEDLGAVPGYVRPAMRRHGLRRMYVLHYELISDARKGLSPVPANAVASLNTHDMAPFAGFWEGNDTQQRLELGFLDKAGATLERQERRKTRSVLVKSLKKQGWLKGATIDADAVLKGCLSFLAASRAPVVLVNLEDLWEETQPQNVPGTGDRYPSWRRKARYSLEQFRRMPQVTGTLEAINQIRKRGLR